MVTSKDVLRNMHNMLGRGYLGLTPDGSISRPDVANATWFFVGYFGIGARKRSSTVIKTGVGMQYGVWG